MSRSRPCPVCGKPDWCRLNETGAVECHRIAAGAVGDYQLVGYTANERFAVYRPRGDGPGGGNGPGTAEPGGPPVRKSYREPAVCAAALTDELGGTAAAVYQWSETFARIRIDLPGGAKTFRPIVRGRLGWSCRAPDKPHGLYRAAELPADGPVFVVEGEKAADAAWSIGLPAVTSGGATSAPDADWSPLAGHKVVILPDNDDPGRAYARAVAEVLRGLAPPATVRIVELPGLPPSGDLWDFVNILRDGQDAETVRAEVQSLCAAAPEEVNPFLPRTARDLLTLCPRLREPVIEGVAREGEIVNIIAPPKTGKSWLALDLALAVATGRPWLGHATRAGRVLLIDNELHPETPAHRIPQVANARSILFHEYGDALHIETVRGQDVDLFTIEKCFSGVSRGMYRLVILDAMYRFWPRDCDENSNAGATQVYNALDMLAERLRCVFVLIHHSTKGNQSNKAVVDVGAGAGAMARATDAHIVLRPHAEPGAVVLDGAVRSWPPPLPRCFRWAFPVWLDAVDLDPADLRPERSRKKPEPAAAEAPPPAPAWTPERFVRQFLTATPVSKAAVVTAAETAGLTERRATRLLTVALETGAAHQWTDPADRRKVGFATTPQPLTETR